LPVIEAGFCGAPDPKAADALVQFGPTILVDTGWDQQFNYASIPLQSLPASGSTNIPALVDTGACESCIDEALAQNLGLPMVDRQVVAGVGGQLTVNVYLAHLSCAAIGHLMYGRFSGVHLTTGGQPHRAVIGRTFLQGLLMIYDGANGSVQLLK
jgi:predicted aspartyl protease